MWGRHGGVFLEESRGVGGGGRRRRGKKGQAIKEDQEKNKNWREDDDGSQVVKAPGKLEGGGVSARGFRLSGVSLQQFGFGLLRGIAWATLEIAG